MSSSIQSNHIIRVWLLNWVVCCLTEGVVVLNVHLGHVLVEVHDLVHILGVQRTSLGCDDIA